MIFRKEIGQLVKEVELFNVQYKEGSLEPKTAELIKFAVNLAIDHKHGANSTGESAGGRRQ